MEIGTVIGWCIVGILAAQSLARFLVWLFEKK